jgi:uncharacterized protein involved in cysteine biosynthesis
MMIFHLYIIKRRSSICVTVIITIIINLLLIMMVWMSIYFVKNNIDISICI